MFFAAPACMAQEATSSQAAYTFSGKDAASAVTEALAAAGAEGEIKVHINGISAEGEETVASAAAAMSADVQDVQLDKARNHWQATLLLKAGDRNMAPLRLAGTWDEMTQVPVLKRPLQSADIISENDIEWSQQPLAHIRKTTITDIKDLIGKSPKRMITQGRPIRSDEVANPAIIAKGARITLMFKTPNLIIKTLGEAMDSGAKGDVIRVKNVESKQIIEGTVETGDLVRVTSPDSTSAEAM